MKLNVKSTVATCFIGSMVQAFVINFPPLLYVTFERSYGISLSKISILIAISFITQLLMDFVASRVPKLFNNRQSVVLGQFCSAAGLVGIAVLPDIIPPFAGLIMATVVAAFGGGIIEVMGNPIIEALPIKNKNRILSFLHSGYCFGVVFTIVLSTLFFHFIGIEHWKLFACLLAIIPALNAVAFMFVPIYKIESAPEKQSEKKSVFHTFIFWAFFIIMACAGAAELSMSQWVSSFADMGLGVSKSVGDILGPCAFALLMGIARVFYAKQSEKINLLRFMLFSSILCVFSYLLAALSPHPIIALVGCAICGFSVGIMWPGTICMATNAIPHGGVKMFALLALAGDMGCTLGPTAVGWIADVAGNNLKLSFVLAIAFPLTMIAFIIILAVKNKNFKSNLTRKDSE